MQALLTESAVTFIALVFVFSLLIGSFLNVVIYRLPVMMSKAWRAEAEEILAEPAEDLPEGRFDLVQPRSRCRSCGTQITALQNIPVISYLLLGGKCAACGVRISPRYPIVELLTAALSAVVAWRFGLGPEAVVGIGITWTLVAISVIDIDHQIIPDSIVLPLLWAGLIASLFSPVPGAQTLFIDPASSIVGAAIGYLSLWTVYHGFRLVTGKEGMGHGDFKLLGAFGAWLGWNMLPLIILLSAVVGAIVGIGMIALRGHDRNIPIPFGPYLAAAGWIAMLYGEQIVTSYLKLF